MEAIWFELVIILVLILANGFFAGAELAIVSVRRGRIAQLAAEGNERAKVVDLLHADPHRFLATVPIGLTLVGTLAAAVEVIKPVVQQIPVPFVSNSAEPLAILLVVGLIVYLSLILDELVPRALALEHSETIALFAARPIRILARIGGIAVSILTVSSRAVLALLGIKGKGERAFVTKEEVQHLIAEAREIGTVTVGEQEFIRNVFEFSQTQDRRDAHEIMRFLGGLHSVFWKSGLIA
jgi:putative hemolysin